MGEFWRDFSYGVRILLKKPGFASAAVLTLAAGIGATTAIFSVVNAVLLRALPYRDADRLVAVWEDASSFGFPENTPAPGNYTEWKLRNRVFEDVAAVADTSFNILGEGVPGRIQAHRATTNLFSVLGVQPALGRVFRPEEDRPGNEKVVLLGHGLWVRRFGADPKIVGREIRMDGGNYLVVGVMPRGFSFPDRDSEMWVPFGFSTEQWSNKGSHYLQVFARLKPGVTLGQANADLTSVAEALTLQFPDTNAKLGAFAVSLRDQIAGRLRWALFTLLGAAAFVLLIACANVANLLLARATGRRREMAVRMSLGASRARILRQLLTESFVLAGLAGGIGLLFSVWAAKFLWQLVPDQLAKPEGTGLDWLVLGFAFFVSLGTGLLFGSAPAWRTARVNLNESLKEAGRGGVGPGGGRLREILVGGEVALAMVLLTGAALFIESLAKLRGVDLGYRPDHVLTLRTPLPRLKYGDGIKRAAFYDAVLDRVSHLPGVLAAGFTTWVPLTNYGGATGITIEGKPEPKPGQMPIPNTRVVSKDYFGAMGMSLKAGRLIDERDGPKTLPVALVNQAMARKWWPSEDPIGRRFKVGRHSEDSKWITIIGIVVDVRQAGVEASARPEMYFPYQQQDFFSPAQLAIRSSGDPMKIAELIRQKIWEVDPEQPVSGVMTMDDLVDQDLSPRMIQTVLLGSFAGLALLLASIGIYAVLSFTVAQRTQEIGLRMALGAQPRDVFSLVLSKASRPLLAGLAIGIAGALALHKVVAHLLYEVSATDPFTIAGVVVVLGLAAFVACYVPARRATRVDPMIALRYE